MQDEDRGATEEPATPDRREESPEAEQDPAPARRPVGGLGGLGCLTMVLAAAAAIALLSTGRFFAVVAGIVIIAVAIGVGLWLLNVAGGRTH